MCMGVAIHWGCGQPIYLMWNSRGPTWSSGDTVKTKTDKTPAGMKNLFWLWKNINSYTNNEMSVKEKEKPGDVVYDIL